METRPIKLVGHANQIPHETRNIDYPSSQMASLSAMAYAINTEYDKFAP